MLKKLMQLGVFVVIATSLIAPLLNINTTVSAAEEDIFAPLSISEISIEFTSRTDVKVKFPDKPAFTNGETLTYDAMLSDTYHDTDIDGRFSYVSTTGGSCGQSGNPELVLGTADSLALTNDGNAEGWQDVPVWNIAHFNNIELKEICIDGEALPTTGLTSQFELTGGSDGLEWKKSLANIRVVRGAPSDYAIDWGFINISMKFTEGSDGSPCLEALDGGLILCNVAGTDTFVAGVKTINVAPEDARNAERTWATFSPPTRTDRIWFFGGDADLSDVSIGAGSSASGDYVQTCTTETKGVFSWAVCGILEMIDDLLEFVIRNLIEDGLGIEFKINDPAPGSNPVTQESYDNTRILWSTFRTIANVMFVLGFMVMIFGQSLGLDAYMIKKMAPRIAMAAILVQLSWVLSIEVLHWFNIIGGSIQDLLYAPFGGEPEIPFMGEAGAALFSGVAIVLAMGLLSSLAIAAPIAISVIGSFATIIFRNILIFILLILSPIAAVLWILPNTEKYAKMWWSWFVKALMVYPMIMALLAAGRIASTISTTGGGAFGSIIGIAVFFAPFFMIPFVFKFAGGAIGAVSSMGQNLSKAGGAKVKEWEKPRVAERRGRAKQGNLYKNKGFSAVAGGLTRNPLDTTGRAAKKVAGSKLGGKIPGVNSALGRRVQASGDKARARSDAASMASFQESAREVKDGGISDKHVLNFMGEETRSVGDMDKKAREWEDEAVAADAAGDTAKATGLRGRAAQMRSAKKFAGNSRHAVGAVLLNQSYGFASDEAIMGLGNSVGSDGLKSELLNYGGSLAKSAGRPDQGPGMFGVDGGGNIVQTGSRNDLASTLKGHERAGQKFESLESSQQGYIDLLSGTMNKDTKLYNSKALLNKTDHPDGTTTYANKGDAEVEAIKQSMEVNFGTLLGPNSNTDDKSKVLLRNILYKTGRKATGSAPGTGPTGPGGGAAGTTATTPTGPFSSGTGSSGSPPP